MKQRTKTKGDNRNLELFGNAIASGLAIGKAFIYKDILRRYHELYDIANHEVEDEYIRIERAIEKVIQDLELSAKRVENEIEKDLANIFHAQKAILQDPSLLDEIKK